MPVHRPITAKRWRREVEWVYKHLSDDDEKRLARIKPSRGAFALWQAAKADPKWFLERFVSRIIVQQLENGTMQEEAGKVVMGEFELAVDRALLEMSSNGEVLRPGTERQVGESVVAEGDVAAVRGESEVASGDGEGVPGGPVVLAERVRLDAGCAEGGAGPEPCPSLHYVLFPG